MNLRDRLTQRTDSPTWSQMICSAARPASPWTPSARASAVRSGRSDRVNQPPRCAVTGAAPAGKATDNATSAMSSPRSADPIGPAAARRTAGPRRGQPGRCRPTQTATSAASGTDRSIDELAAGRGRGAAHLRWTSAAAVICTGRALHHLSSLLLPAPAPARPACDPTNPCTCRTQREGLPCPDPSAASASHCQRC